MASDAGTISQIGPIALRWYGLLFATSFLLGYYLGSKTFEHAGKPQQQPETLFLYLMAGTVTRRATWDMYFSTISITTSGTSMKSSTSGRAGWPPTAPLPVFCWLSTPLPENILIPAFCGRPTAFAIPFAIGGAFVRIGNFFNSEILGSPTDVSWAVIFAREDMVPRHPAMLYESFSYLIIFILLIVVYRYFRNNPPVGGVLTGYIHGGAPGFFFSGTVRH